MSVGPVLFAGVTGDASESTSAPLRRVYIAAFFMDGAFSLMMAAIPFKILALGGGPMALGIVPAVASLTYIVFAQLAGRWSDRGDRTWFCLAGSCVLIGFAFLAYPVGELELLILLMPVMSLGKALFWPALQAAVGDICPASRLARITAYFNIAWSGGKGLGFLAGGLLLAAFDFRITFLCGGGLALCSLLALAGRRLVPSAGSGPGPTNEGSRSPADRVAEPDEPGVIPAEIRRTFRHLGWLANLAANGMAGVLVYHLPKWFAVRGWDESRFGLVLAAIFLAQTATFFLLAGRIRFAYSVPRLLIPQLAAGLVVAAVPWLGSYWLLLALTPVLGASFGISYEASIYYSLHARTGRGRNAGVHESLVGLGGFLPPLLGGLAASASGWLGAPYLLAAACLFLALWWQYALWRRCRSPRCEPGPGGAQ